MSFSGMHVAGEQFEVLDPATGDVVGVVADASRGGIKSQMLIAREETFGPVAGVTAFTREREVIALANDTPYGLAAYVNTRDYTRLIRMAERLDFGVIGANDGAPSTPGCAIRRRQGLRLRPRGRRRRHRRVPRHQVRLHRRHRRPRPLRNRT